MIKYKFSNSDAELDKNEKFVKAFESPVMTVVEDNMNEKIDSKTTTYYCKYQVIFFTTHWVSLYFVWGYAEEGYEYCGEENTPRIMFEAKGTYSGNLTADSTVVLTKTHAYDVIEVPEEEDRWDWREVNDRDESLTANVTFITKDRKLLIADSCWPWDSEKNCFERGEYSNYLDGTILKMIKY